MRIFPEFSTLALIALCFTNVTFSQEISDVCLGCLCEASTGCNQDQGCSDAGVCGPFLITRPFWVDGGKYTIKGTDCSDPKAYEECVKDLFCASETIRGYTAKYAKDCNGDGKIDCDDFARIHKLGGFGCENSNFVNTKFYQQFNTCNTRVLA